MSSARAGEMLISVILHLQVCPEFYLCTCVCVCLFVSVCVCAASWTTTTSAASKMERSELYVTWKFCEYCCVDVPPLTCGSAAALHNEL